MKETLDSKTKWAIRHYGDEATQQFYAHLRERKLMSTRCQACSETMFPPRSFCPVCLGRDVEWFELPKRGRIYAFTTQQRSMRFMDPEVIGLVELDGVGRILTHFTAPLDELSIGQEVELDFHVISDDLVAHCFRPKG